MKVLNINVGVMGHVDSGKTSLVEKLSTLLSTAALDKHPQSQERGITLDLGFSAFQVPFPNDKEGRDVYDTLQFTLVDCPGHASLIRTVLGGAHIMDMMLLVVDVTEGIQVQTAECLVIGEMVTEKIVVALNKIDRIPKEKIERTIHKATKHISQTLKLTSYETFKIVPVSAKTGDGIDELSKSLIEMMEKLPERKRGPFLFAIDHCFRIKGQGTVITGTALQGSISIHDSIELPVLKEARKIKSIQMFKKNVDSIEAGDRAGICIPNLDPSRIERGLAATPGSVPTFKILVANVQKVRFYADPVKSGQKLHFILGHNVAMGTITLFKSLNASSDRIFSDAFPFVEELDIDEKEGTLAIVVLDHSLTSPLDLALVGARLETATESQSCRMALKGHILQTLKDEDLSKLQIYRLKERNGTIKRVMDDGMTAICGGMFKKETNFAKFKGSQVLTTDGLQGTLIEAHGGHGDFLVRFQTKIVVHSQNDTAIRLFSKKFLTIHEFTKSQKRF